MTQIEIIMLILLSLFYITYFMKALILKTRGIKSNHLGKGDKPQKTLIVELVLLFITFLVFVMQYLSIFIPDSLGVFDLGSFVNYFGIALTAIGVIIFNISMCTMRNNWRSGISETQLSTLVTKGIYRYSRNPAFLGFDLFYIGSMLALNNIALVIVVIISVIVLHMQILEEERILIKVFKDQYIDYQKKVRRYL